MARPVVVVLLLILCNPILALSNSPRPRPTLRGDESAVLSLIDRVLPTGSASHFDLSLTATTSDDCAPGVAAPCFSLSDSSDGRVSVLATSASELSAGVGWYLRQRCNMTIGWPRGGGSRTFLPEAWPTIGPAPVVRRRNSAHSYLMNVCTHSYSLAWYSWSDWERFIDWMALSGINLFLAMTGQEEVQYKVFRKLGLSDGVIRGWFNGPALLTWSRGQNEYGSGMLGPLPRSWMRDQWDLQRRILTRVRSLGIVGQLPGFQGNVPVQLKALYNDTNITEAGGTGWMDSLDPLFGKIADLWMTTLIEDFGTDHWYQLDGYFDGGTAPWFESKDKSAASSGGGAVFEIPEQRPFQGSSSPPLLRNEQQRQRQLSRSEVQRDIMAYRRAAAAYTGLNRTDPDAVWSFQGWAVIGWSTLEQAAIVKGFVESTPHGKFVIIDMEPSGRGEFHYFNESAFFGAPFIWTSLHNFGGTDGLKGHIAKVNEIPFQAPPSANVIGTGATPEGIDQNTIYYEFIFEQNFRNAPVQDVAAYTIERGHRRYGLSQLNEDITKAWALLADSAYSLDLGVQDGTGIAHLPPRGESPWFEADRRTPKPWLCKIYAAWGYLLRAGEESSTLPAFRTEPFLYDLVNTGREVLANIATPASLNFSDATARPIMDRDELLATGNFYVDLLNDADTLVGTDKAFLLGSWIESARRLGAGHTDCSSPILGNDGDCENFLEWNARTQLTTWKPVPKGSPSIPRGPVDYAAKHWNGLIKDYYGVRARLTQQQALQDQSAGQDLDRPGLDRILAKHAHDWTTSQDQYPTSPVADALAVSRVMHDKYGQWFASCDANLHS